MAATNYVGSVTLAASTTVGLFATTSITATAGVFEIFGGGASGLVQVPSSSVSTPTYPVTGGPFAAGGAELYIRNTTASSITFSVRFASTS
jgi:hypothetical protein